MYCVYCGKEIPSDASFCSYCGKAQTKSLEKLSPPSSSTQPRWETCEISQKLVSAKWLSLKVVFIFEAWAIGPKGNYCAARSAPYEVPMLKFGPVEEETREGKAALKAFIGQLTKDNWDSVGRGITWYSYSFQRKH